MNSSSFLNFSIFLVWIYFLSKFELVSMKLLKSLGLPDLNLVLRYSILSFSRHYSIWFFVYFPSISSAKLSGCLILFTLTMLSRVHTSTEAALPLAVWHLFFLWNLKFYPYSDFILSRAYSFGAAINPSLLTIESVRFFFTRIEELPEVVADCSLFRLSFLLKKWG